MMCKKEGRERVGRGEGEESERRVRGDGKWNERKRGGKKGGGTKITSFPAPYSQFSK